MTKNINYIAVIALGILFAICAVILQKPQTASANISDATFIGAATTTASFSVTSSARILATSTSPIGASFTRVYATICNPNANPVYVSLNVDKAASATSATTVIAAAAGYNACYEITGRNTYQGSITASSTGQTATTIFVSDYVQ